ncbi:hypothetical protein [Lysobacter gummosus]|uniref:hypothetical protein n=1 Tax=Lysobacter gummosus TaxID=262324 RepID=UPI003628CE76
MSRYDCESRPVCPGHFSTLPRPHRPARMPSCPTPPWTICWPRWRPARTTPRWGCWWSMPAWPRPTPMR